MDKALLLVTLLHRSGIDAAPALVSGSYRAALAKLLPSPDILDQALVQVRIGEATHWLKPSATEQRGPLSQIYVPPYGYALVLRPGINELISFEPPPWYEELLGENACRVTEFGVLVDTVLVDRIPSAVEPALTSLRHIAPLIVTAAIWIPYVSFSKRVKATFRY